VRMKGFRAREHYGGLCRPKGQGRARKTGPWVLKIQARNPGGTGVFFSQGPLERPKASPGFVIQATKPAATRIRVINYITSLYKMIRLPVLTS